MNALQPDKIDDAVVWLIAHWFEAPRPLVPNLKRKFGLTALEAVQVIRRASDRRMEAWQ